MTAPKQERETITLFLDEYLEDYLGEDHCRPIRANIAVIVESKVKNKCVYHVEWRTDSDIPMLWRHKYWADSVERYTKQKERSERERVARFIFDANVRSVAYWLVRNMCLDDDRAKALAFSILKKPAKIMWFKLHAIGINKLVEKESEL